MGKDDLIEQFIKAVTLLAKISSSIEDRFFSDRLIGEISSLGLNLINFLVSEDKSDSTQSMVLLEKSLTSISSLIRVLEDLSHLNIITNSFIFLQIERNLLTVKLGLISKNKRIITKHIEDKIKQGIAEDKKLSIDELALSKPRRDSFVIDKRDKFSHGINPNKKKILEFIKSSPNIRTKDIIYEFSSISGRTVKRNLTELAREGLVVKKIDNKAVYYYASG